MTDVREPHPRPLSTLYARMLVPFAAALALGTILAWWIGTTLLSTTLESRVAVQLHHAVDLLSEPGFPIVEPVLQRLDKLLLASIFLLDSDGKLQNYGGSAPAAGLQSALQEQYRMFLEQRADEFQFRADGVDYLLVLREFETGDTAPGRVVAACAELSDVRTATRRGGLWLAALTFCGITVLALIGYRISRSVTEPVAELAAMAGAIAQGQRNVRVDISRRDEVGALAQSLNTMAEDLRDYEEQMLERHRMATLGELSARVAHEIRNPLTAIRMQLQLLEDELLAPARPRLAALLDEVDRLELIVASTLEMARPDAMHRQPTDINQLVGGVLRLLEPRFRHLRMQTRVELTDALPLCPLDADRVKQILLNLLNNAVEELPQGGVIGVRTRLTVAGELALEIADSGAGIAPETRQQLFQGGSSSKATGLGLGLRVTRELVELHGGSIEVGDSDLGGALFRVLFPLEI